MSDVFISGIVVFVLAAFVGLEVISKVPPTLHTPLMSGANAISGITIVGALVAAGIGEGATATILGFLAVTSATINVVGGFLVTDRMLEMFKRKPPPKREPQTVTELLYLTAAVLFILGLKQLSGPRTARRGNTIAASGMLLAIVVTLVDTEVLTWGTILAGLVAGGAIGALLALRVQMTAMPQLVAAFNGFGGLASALVALAELDLTSAAFPTETAVTVVLSIAIGAITFTGSFVAFGKLQG